METKRIEWMDLKRQFDVNEQEFMKAVHSVCRDVAFSGGKYATIFEGEFAEYCGVKRASGVSNGTAALFLGMKALGIGEGDEVIIPADTFVASAWGASHNGAVPVFVDIHPDTFEIDVTKIEGRITPKTKAILGVHLYGQPFDVDAVREVACRHNLFVIEDCAQAHGALYKGQKVGGLGDVGCFSFYPGKNLGSFGEAGIVTSNNEEVITAVDILKSHGAAKTYHHDVIGYNMRMEGIQGSILSCKLRHLDTWNNRRREIAKQYQRSFNNPKIKLQYQPEWAESVYHIFCAEVDDRERFIEWMKKNGITCGIHYPIPCHLQKAYAHLGYKIGDLPIAEYHAEHCVSLPMYPELTDPEVARVIEVCNAY